MKHSKLRAFVVSAICQVGFAVLLFPLALHAQLYVDCSGTDPSAYPSISAALPDVGDGSTIIVTGTCNEFVTLWNVKGINLGAAWGQRASINGGIAIWDSKYVYLYGLDIANSPADGIGAYHSTSVYVDTCTSNGNAVVGLAARYMSDVTVLNMGSFDYNSAHGIYLDGSSSILLLPWGGPVDISNNGASGVYAGTGGYFGSWGNTTIAGSAGWGVELYGASRFNIGTFLGPSAIEGNSSGGASILEGSEFSFWAVSGLQGVIRGNGPTGVSVGLGSQATFALDGVQISDHTSAGVDVFANSQANFSGPNSVFRNGRLSDPRSAGIRLDGNSQALLRGGDVSRNSGPGILALVNSSVDFTGVTFSGDTGGIISCDSSASMISDIAQPNPASGVRCKTPHALGNRNFTRKPPAPPELTPYKALQARYRKLATRH